MKEYCNREPDAIDVSIPSLGSQELVSRFKDKFLKEAKLIASLDDPNIVLIHDVFEENGTAYYIMEFLTGGSLADGAEILSFYFNQEMTGVGSFVGSFFGCAIRPVTN